MSNSFFNKIWKDSVWSKVIGAIIFGILNSLYVYVSAIVTNKSFTTSFYNFWTFSLPLWMYFAGSLLIVIVYLLVKSSGNRNIKTDVSQDSKNNVFFESTKSELYSFKLRQLQLWDSETKAQVGKKGTGTLEFKDGILTINRTNNEGRVVVGLDRYNHGTEKFEYIRSNTTGEANRLFIVSFECRVISKKHELTIAFVRRDLSWIISQTLEVNEIYFRVFDISFRVSSSEDFHIDFQDINAEEPSIIQFKNIQVKEIL